LISEVGKERRHDLGVVAAVAFSTESLVFKGVSPGGVASFLTGVELVKFVGRKWGDAKKRFEEDFRVFVVSREDGIDGKWGKRDIDNSQCGGWAIFSRSEVVDDGGVELVRVREVEVEAAATSESFGAQGTLVEMVCRVEDEGMVLEVTVAGGGEDAVWAVERRQERRHTPVGER